VAELIPYLAVFAAGFVGSVHCVGMCGGFACALCASRDRSLLPRQLLYNLGRVTTYVFLGALAAGAGALVMHHGMSWGSAAQRLLAVLSGALLIVIALQFFGYRLSVRFGRAAFLTDSLAAGLRGMARSPRLEAPLALGVLNGFLPCPLVYAFAVQAAATASVLPGMAVMAAFGLGTFPAMLLMGFGGAVMGPRLQRARVAGALLLVLGLITLARAMLPAPLHGIHL
jgi:sulfite exporter TauE/SafE